MATASLAVVRGSSELSCLPRIAALPRPFFRSSVKLLTIRLSGPEARTNFSWHQLPSSVSRPQVHGSCDSGSGVSAWPRLPSDGVRGASCQKLRTPGIIPCSSRTELPGGDSSDLADDDDNEAEIPLGDQSTVNGVVALIMPRRRLKVEFTCKPCGGRTTRMVNPFAFKKGTVFVQCNQCGVWHQLADNLGLIKEYDLRLDSEE